MPQVLDFHVELNLLETFLALTDELFYTKYCKYPLLSTSIFFVVLVN